MSVERHVLDSFALLAYFENEPSAAVVERILRASELGEAESWLSVINFGELVYITERRQGLQAAQRVIATIDQLPVRVVDVDRSWAFAAAHVKANRALSYADAFAVVLASEIEARVVTGDPEFEKVEDLVSVFWLDRRPNS